MQLQNYLVDILKYNLWANNKIAGFIVAAGDDRAGMQLKSSFPSIRETLIHILNAQLIWMNRVNGINDVTWPVKHDTSSVSELGKMLSDNCEEWIRIAADGNDQLMSREIRYKNLKGEPFTSMLSEIIIHLVNHGTFHRGQLVTMLRETGFTDLSSTDLITWYRVRD